MRCREIGCGQGWYYPKERTIILWECFLDRLTPATSQAMEPMPSMIPTCPRSGPALKTSLSASSLLRSSSGRRSPTFSCPALVVRNHDNDILPYELYEAGARTDAYDSWPGYFDEDDDAPMVPSGADPLRLCAALH